MKPKIKNECNNEVGTVGKWELVEESDDYYKVNRVEEITCSDPIGVRDTFLGKRANDLI